jgi:hypothetical protein
MSSFSSEAATTQTAAARLGIEERQVELTTFLMAEDPLPVVLRAHIHIEEELVASTREGPISERERCWSASQRAHWKW